MTLLRSIFGGGTPGPHGGVTMERVYATITSVLVEQAERGARGRPEIQRREKKGKKKKKKKI